MDGLQNVSQETTGAFIFFSVIFSIQDKSKSMMYLNRK